LIRFEAFLEVAALSSLDLRAFRFCCRDPTGEYTYWCTWTGDVKVVNCPHNQIALPYKVTWWILQTVTLSHDGYSIGLESHMTGTANSYSVITWWVPQTVTVSHDGYRKQLQCHMTGTANSVVYTWHKLHDK